MSAKGRAGGEGRSAEACIRALALPAALENAALEAAALTSMRETSPASPPELARSGRLPVEPAFPADLPPPWRIVRDGPPAAPGWSLWDGDRNGSARLWLSVDGFGGLRGAARWHDSGLVWARFPLAEGAWLSLAPRAGTHPLWGVCDAVTAEPGTVARLPAQDWLALREIPPVDDPGALPPGGGAALLNFVAELMRARGVASVRYHGPYPTAHLFEALCRSFHWIPPPAASGAPEATAPAGASLAAQRSRLLERFSAGSWAAALRAAPSEWSHPDIAWRPNPFASSAPHPDVGMHWRRGVDAVRLGGHGFDAPAEGVPLSGGCRVWPEAGGWAAGIVLLGQPWRTLARFDASGALVSYDPPQAPAEAVSVPMDAAWRTALVDWTAVAAAPALASAVTALEAGLQPSWSALPWSVAVPGPAPLTVRIQAGLGDQFRRLVAQGQPAASLALMAVSDAMANAQPLLLRWAQARLAQSDARPDPDSLVQAGNAAQVRARQRLAATLPALVARLARGEGWSSR